MVVIALIGRIKIASKGRIVNRIKGDVKRESDISEEWC
jgi:hypothetical protein